MNAVAGNDASAPSDARGCDRPVDAQWSRRMRAECVLAGSEESTRAIVGDASMCWELREHQAVQAWTVGKR